MQNIYSFFISVVYKIYHIQPVRLIVSLLLDTSQCVHFILKGNERVDFVPIEPPQAISVLEQAKKSQNLNLLNCIKILTKMTHAVTICEV